jgi:hypothetical protein
MNKCEWCGQPLDSEIDYQKNYGLCDEECFVKLRENEKHQKGEVVV